LIEYCWGEVLYSKLTNEQNPEECDATDDAMEICRWVNKVASPRNTTGLARDDDLTKKINASLYIACLQNRLYV
jgi:hypothetical protein